MSILFNKIAVQIDLEAIRHNYRLLRPQNGHAFCVIKADAYGHGLLPVAQALAQEGARHFAVGTVEEGAFLRQAGMQGEILSLLGPADAADYEPLWEYGLIPAVHSFDILNRLARHAAGRKEKLKVCLKFDTGMHRLGFRPEDALEVGKAVAGTSGLDAAYAFSHLARADEDGGDTHVRAQLAAFDQACADLARAGLRPKRHLANSAGILGHDLGHLDACRPGIALYGANPFAGTSHEELGARLRPAMSVTAPLVSVHDLREGETLSYGGTFTADHPMTIGILAAGYADAYSRGLSGRAQVCLRGMRVPVLGRVCMQLTAIDLTDMADALPGDRAYLLGGEGEGAVSPQDLAGWWGTIPYEVFCLLGLNKREYVNAG